MVIFFEKSIKAEHLEPNTGQIPGVPANPRKWTKDALASLAKSIEETPELLAARRILVYPHEGKFVVLGGNMRLAACLSLGYDEMPCLVVQEPDGEIPAEKLKEIVIKDNGSFGEWDYDRLAGEWDDLPLPDWGVPAWDSALASGFGAASGKDDDDFDFDGKDTVIARRCKAGDIWQCGKHRVMCGDSADSDAVKTLMGGGKADMVFTDPPYGVSIGDKNKTLNSVQPSGRCTANIENDTLSSDELYPILVKAMTNARENCKDDACYYVTSPQGGELGLMMMMKDAGLPVRHMLIWKKDSATFSLGRLDYDYQHEPIFYTWTKKHHNYRGGDNRTTVWEYPKPRKCDLHPTMKPVALVENCMRDATKEGDIVLDLFGGSGTTMIAAENLGRKARLMELDPHYCDVIISRWENATGLRAEKIQ